MVAPADEATRQAPTLLTGLGSCLRRREPPDARAVLTAFVLVLLLIPAVLVVGPLGAAGSPSTLFGLGLLVWWLCSRMLPGGSVARGYQPARIAIGVLGLVVLASYLYGNLFPLGGDERSSADRGLLTVASWIGIVLSAPTCSAVGGRWRRS